MSDEEKKPEAKKKATKGEVNPFSYLFSGVGNGLGCFFIMLGFVAIIWAFSGFPGLPR